jgi:hypothetical protein
MDNCNFIYDHCDVSAIKLELFAEMQFALNVKSES